MNEWFERMAVRLTAIAGSLVALLAACVMILVWLVSGPLFRFSDTWQLVINTTTTIITFLMVFLIQSSTNREAKATQLKLDELIRALEGARNEIIAADKKPVEAMADLEQEFEELAERGGVDTGHFASTRRRIRRHRAARRRAHETPGRGRTSGEKGTKGTGTDRSTGRGSSNGRQPNGSETAPSNAGPPRGGSNGRGSNVAADASASSSPSASNRQAKGGARAKSSEASPKAT